MSSGIRLPTLYPLPTRLEQYWTCYEAAIDEPSEDEYAGRLRHALTKDDGQPYSDSMVDKLCSNLIGKGFVRRQRGRVLPPDTVPHHTWDGTWDGSQEGFTTYVDMTLLKWGWLFQNGLVLTYDILSELQHGPRSVRDLWVSLTDPEHGTGKYQPDRYGRRTLGETLRLARFAGWVEREEGKAKLTSSGSHRRTSLRERDVYHTIERIFARVDPVQTDIFTNIEKIELVKAVMYRQSGGIGKDTPVRRAHEALFRRHDGRPYSGLLHPEIKAKIDEGGQRLKELRHKIADRNAAIGRRVESTRSEEKLTRVLDALEAGLEHRASLILDSSGAGLSLRALESLKHDGPSYSLRPNLVPYAWQSLALKGWLERERRGVLEVVTGAGKTFFALMATAQYLENNPSGVVSVLVPTKVLMYQWVAELVRVLGVPPSDIGLRGDGHKDGFSDGKVVVVSIINSAILNEQLKTDVEGLASDIPHLLIADECHRYRGDEFSRVFETRFDSSLGLSATPEDPNHHGDAAGPVDPLVDALGQVFFKYSYWEALEDGVIQPFVVHYVGVDLTPEERAAHDLRSRRIRRAMKKIRQRYGPRLEAMKGPLYARLHSILNSDDNPDASIRRFFEAVRERKEIVYSARDRRWAYLDIMTKHTLDKEDGEDRIIVFHERIENLEEIIAPVERRTTVSTLTPEEAELNKRVEDLFFKRSFRAVMYHSGWTSQVWNETSMEFFREGLANVMLSVKALVEGVDVPAANVGIIRASSSSVRQRIQTTGRILRRSATKKQPADLYVIYVRDTTDERIFRGVDWSEELGSSAIQSFHWHPPDDPREVAGQWEDLGNELPTVEPAWEDEPVAEFDVSDLDPGDQYPGRYAGQEYHVDAGGRPFKRGRDGRRFILNDEVVQAAAVVFRKKRGGKFVLTPEGHMVARVDGELMYLGVLSEDIRLEDTVRRSLQSQSGDPPTFADLFGTG